MKRALKLTVMILVAVLLSACLAPILYAFLPFFKFEKILNRLLMISALVICFSFIRIDRLFLEQCGLFKQPDWWRHWLVGFGVSFVVLLSLVILQFELGALGFRSDVQLSFRLFLSAGATAVTVGLIEEFFFRGFTYLNLKKQVSPVSALITTNVIYALVHFLRGGHPYVDATPTVWDSFRILGSSFEAFLKWDTFWPSFIGLFLFGLVLSSAFLRTGSLYWSIGLHSGAVFFLKLTHKAVEVQPGFSELIYGGKGFYSGLLGWLFIGLIWGVLMFLLRRFYPGRA